MDSDGIDFAVIHTDGGARPTNPGHAGFGIVVEFPNSEREDHELSRYLGRRRTNNEAELIGAYVGIGYSYFLGARSIELRVDSKLVHGAITGLYHVNSERIKFLARDGFDKIRALYGEDNWDVVRIPREENSRADALATAAAFWGMGQNPFLPSKVRDKYRQKGKIIDPFRLGPEWASA